MPVYILQKAKLALDSLTIYRNLIKDNVINKFIDLLDIFYYQSKDVSSFLNTYSEFFHVFEETGNGQTFSEYIMSLVLYDDNTFARKAASIDPENIAAALTFAAECDIACINEIIDIDAALIKRAAIQLYDEPLAANRIIRLPEWDCGVKRNFTKKEIIDFYFHNGTGIFAKFKSFIWNTDNNEENRSTELKGIKEPDPVKLNDLIGYEEERKAVVENTVHFLKGYNANNVLLYGDRGTGKSSTVKALLNEFESLGLKMIEVPKAYLSDFPKIISKIRNRPHKFILFVDDLAFEDSEESYTALKAILEGGLESKPNNVVIYTTSNRRHLIKEKFSDRSGLSSGSIDDEVRSADAIQEKLSLSDRFGITVTFSSPDKLRYLQIVDGLAKIKKLNVDTALLHKEALKWEHWQNGISPRTARQFIDWYEAKSGSSV